MYRHHNHHLRRRRRSLPTTEPYQRQGEDVYPFHHNARQPSPSLSPLQHTKSRKAPCLFRIYIQADDECTRYDSEAVTIPSRHTRTCILGTPIPSYRCKKYLTLNSRGFSPRCGRSNPVATVQTIPLQFQVLLVRPKACALTEGTNSGMLHSVRVLSNGKECVHVQHHSRPSSATWPREQPRRSQEDGEAEVYESSEA